MYTVIPDKNLERKIQNDLDLIVDRLTMLWPTAIEEIWLIGGFGRDEGSFIKTPAGFLPYNDYDILLVTNTRLSKKETKHVGEQLAHECNIQFVDIGVVMKKSISTLRNSVFSFDLQNIRHLYGTQDLPGLLPTTNLAAVATEESRIQLQNRIICFLEKTPPDFLERAKLLPETHTAFTLQVSKAVIAATISNLLLHNTYTTSYRSQLQTARKLLPANSRLIETAYNLKLGLQEPGDVDPYDFWFAARTYFFMTMQTYDMPTQALLHASPSSTHVPISFRQRSKQIAAAFLGFATMPAWKKQTLLRETAVLLTMAVDMDGRVDEEVVRAARKRLQSFSRRPPQHWPELTHYVTKLWQTYNH